MITVPNRRAVIEDHTDTATMAEDVSYGSIEEAATVEEAGHGSLGEAHSVEDAMERMEVC